LRARQRRRKTIRRVTIIATIVIVAVSLGVGIYILSVANGPTAIDKFIGQAVSTSDITSLYKDSLQPYGPAPSTTMVGEVQSNGGAALTSEGKPVVVYIGAEYCPYCAVQRWGLIMGLMRFGNFSGLQYMTSRPGDVGAGDYPTFTFVGASYVSTYITFRSYEVDDRNGNSLTTVPSNYSVAWSSAGSSFPFMNFANSFTVPGSMIATPQDLTGENWTQVLTQISTSSGPGVEIRQSANLVTALICKLTNSEPASVCDVSPIAAQVSSLSAPAPGSLAFPQQPAVAATPPQVSQRPDHAAEV